MKILVIPEDPVRDQHILKPITERLFADLGKGSPRIDILTNPRLRGVAQALDGAVLSDVVATYPMADLILVLVDRDGNTERSSLARAREGEHPGRLFVCLAVEEIEVWMLAIFPSRFPSWSEVRGERSLKERFATPFLQQFTAEKRSRSDARLLAMRELGPQWKGVLERCPELKELRERLAQRLAS